MQEGVPPVLSGTLSTARRSQPLNLNDHSQRHCPVCAVWGQEVALPTLKAGQWAKLRGMVGQLRAAASSESP